MSHNALGGQFHDIESLQKNSLLGQIGRMRRDGQMDPDDHAIITKSVQKSKGCPSCTYLALDKRDLQQHLSRSHKK